MEEARRLTQSGQPQESRREERDRGGCGEVKELPVPAEDQPRRFSRDGGRSLSHADVAAF